MYIVGLADVGDRFFFFRCSAPYRVELLLAVNTLQLMAACSLLSSIRCCLLFLLIHLISFLVLIVIVLVISEKP